MNKKLRGLLLLLLVIPVAFCLVGCKRKNKNNNTEPDVVTYQVSYELFGGTNNDGNKAFFTSGNEEITLLEPSRDYYEFAGWFDSDSFENQVFVIEANSTENKTFYAKWNPIEYEITYELYGGTNSETNPSKYTVEDEVVFENPTFEPYEFVGWYYGYSGDYFYMPVTKIEVGSHGDKTIHAKWNEDIYFDIHYELNGGVNNAMNPTSYKYDNNIVELLKPTKIGYSFTGWYSDSLLLHKFEYIAPKTTGEITVYAGWEIIEYEIVYELNGGDNNRFNPSTYTIENNLLELRNPTKYGYNFAGWYTDSSLDEEYKITHIDSNLQCKITVYAKWEPKTIKITLDYDGATGNNELEYIEVQYNSEITELPEPTKEEYVFRGWWRNNIEYTVGTTILFNEDITIFAIWIPIEETLLYTVEFDSDGGNIIDNITDIVFGTKISEPTNPTKAGYIFDGWYLGDKKWDFENNKVISNITLTAHWTIIEFTIEYELNGGENPENVVEVYTIEMEDITLPEPTKEGFEFKGWFLDEELTQKIEVIAHDSLKNYKLYASWQRTLFPKANVIIRVKFNLPADFAPLYESGTSEYSDYEVEIQARGGSLPLKNFNTGNFGKYFVKYTYSFTYIDNSGNYADATGEVTDNVYIPLSSYDTEINAIWEEDALLKYYYTDGIVIKVDETNTFAYVSKYTGSSDMVFLPEYYKVGNVDYVVNSIGNQAFVGNMFVSKVIFLTRNSTIEIGNSAFLSTPLSEFDFTYVSRIYAYAFYGTSFESLKFSPNLIYTESSVFEKCKKLVSVDFSNASAYYRYIYSKSFADCENLTTVILKQSIESIGESAFEGCEKLTNIDFITNTADNCSIDSRAFRYCTGLVDVTIPTNITNFGEEVFDGCTSIKRIKFSKFFNTYYGCSFLDVYGISKIEEIEMLSDSTETEIPRVYFEGLRYLEKFVMNDSITIIGEDAFKNCEALSEIVLSKNLQLQYFKLSSFAGTAWITDTQNIIVIETTVVFIPSNESMEEVDLSDLDVVVTAISEEACKDNEYIKKLYIPKSVEIISNSAFEGCINLEEVEFENGSKLKQLLNRVFASCYSVSKFDLSNCTMLEVIGVSAFDTLGKNSANVLDTDEGFVIPNSVTTIGDGAFNNIKVEKFISTGSHFITDNGILYEIDNDGNKISIVVVQKNIVSNFLIIPTTIKKIYSYAFYYSSNISVVYIKGEVELGRNVFKYSTLLASESAKITYTYTSGTYHVLKQLTENYSIVNNKVVVTEDVSEGYYYINVGESVFLIRVARIGEELIVSKTIDITSYFSEM